MSGEFRRPIDLSRELMEYEERRRRRREKSIATRRTTRREEVGRSVGEERRMDL